MLYSIKYQFFIKKEQKGLEILSESIIQNAIAKLRMEL